jgi:hypothetical protein
MFISVVIFGLSYFLSKLMKPKKENVVKIPDHYTQLGAESFKFV